MYRRAVILLLPYYILGSVLTIMLLILLQFLETPTKPIPDKQIILPIFNSDSTIDPFMQQLSETALTNGIYRTRAKRGVAIIIEAQTGAIRSMVNYGQADMAILPWQPGSVMKPLLMAAALNESTVSPDTQFFDQGTVKVQERIITNAIPYPPQNITMTDVLTKSLNTGAVFTLKSLGNGQLNKQARERWHNYLTGHYNFGAKTGVETTDEATGYVRPPVGGSDIEFAYASSAFGLGMTVTPLQLACAYAAITNGGTYYRPYLKASQASPNVLIHNVVSTETSLKIRTMLTQALAVNNPSAIRSGYLVGGKSGTAPVAEENAVYKLNADNGTYVGFIGGSAVQYIMLVRLDEPQTKDFASAQAAQIWVEISSQIIDSGNIQKIKTQTSRVSALR